MTYTGLPFLLGLVALQPSLFFPSATSELEDQETLCFPSLPFGPPNLEHPLHQSPVSLLCIKWGCVTSVCVVDVVVASIS